MDRGTVREGSDWPLPSSPILTVASRSGSYVILGIACQSHVPPSHATLSRALTVPPSSVGPLRFLHHERDWTRLKGAEGNGNDERKRARLTHSHPPYDRSLRSLFLGGLGERSEPIPPVEGEWTGSDSGRVVGVWRAGFILRDHSPTLSIPSTSITRTLHSLSFPSLST